MAVAPAYVDHGYRGHNADKKSVFVFGQKRGVTPTMRREIRRRAGIEPVIGHLKQHGYLGRNFIASATGDAITPSYPPPPATTSVSSAPGSYAFSRSRSASSRSSLP